MSERMVSGLQRLDAPREVLETARRVAEDEARHVRICAHVLGALGFEAEVPSMSIPVLPERDDAFEQALVELLVAGFAVAETMSVGGFAAVRAIAREPLVRWAFAELARDEVRHGQFGELASGWALRDWSAERKRALWPVCVATMEDVERRAGGPVGARQNDARHEALEALGVPGAATTGAALLKSVPRWVLPRLARLGVIPDLPRA
ncbi:MAG TPA: ferritin-like domain-containing protein [Polyangiaceae bacterium]